MPEIEGAMLFECGHAAEHAVKHEVRELPFDSFLHIGAGYVNEFTQMLEDWLGEIGGFGDVSVNSGVAFSHGWLLLGIISIWYANWHRVFCVDWQSPESCR